jgi:hypothetical protein
MRCVYHHAALVWMAGAASRGMPPSAVIPTADEWAASDAMVKVLTHMYQLLQPIGMAEKQ